MFYLYPDGFCSTFKQQLTEFTITCFKLWLVEIFHLLFSFWVISFLLMTKELEKLSPYLFFYFFIKK